MKIKMNDDLKKTMALAGSVMTSLAIGYLVGMCKEKMLGECKCVIEEM